MQVRFIFPRAKICGGLLCALLLACAGRLGAQSNQAVYTDALQNGWVSYGWATLNYANATPVHGGASSISVSSSGYQALYLHHSAQDGAGFTNLTFWINGGSGGQAVQLQATRNGTSQAAVVLAPLPVNAWRQETVSLAALGVAAAADFDGFWLQVQTGGTAPTFYVDDIALIAGTNAPVTNTPTIITVDVLAGRHAISPLIYGTAFASSNELADLNFTLNRSGGNSESRYNWLLNAHNRASDFYFESLDDGSATPAASSDDFIASTKGGGAQPVVTIPMIGWMPKLGANRQRLASFSIAKYGLQADRDALYFPDAGNGVISNSTVNITNNNPNDANFLTNSAFQRAFMQHVTNRWNFSTNGGVRYYCMDNEHTLWNSTHRDVHPVGTTMQEIRDKIFDYAAVVKALDPNALILAPEEWGWPGYLYSGYDQSVSAAYNYNPATYPDRVANGGQDYMPWLLDQLRQRSTNTNQRLLDYFTLHIYPQGNNQGTYETSDDVSTTAQLLRNRSTRQLWDTNYLDPSWINSIIQLIPRMKNWATNYPGTKIGITEYNWGAENFINGATAQADILGIFGRENVDLATRWTIPAASTPTYKAMKMFRNYDGNKSVFGDTSVAAAGPNPDNVSTFAATRSTDGALTLLVINKQLAASASVNFSLTNFLPNGSAQVWQLTAANTISRLSDLAFTGGAFSNTLPAQSVTLFVLSNGIPPSLRAATATNGNFSFWLDGLAGQRYAIQSSSNLIGWQNLQTNSPASNSLQILLPRTNTVRFYRAQWLP